MPHARVIFFLSNIDFGPQHPLYVGIVAGYTSPETFSTFIPTIHLYQNAETAVLRLSLSIIIAILLSWLPRWLMWLSLLQFSSTLPLHLVLEICCSFKHKYYVYIESRPPTPWVYQIFAENTTPNQAYNASSSNSNNDVQKKRCNVEVNRQWTYTQSSSSEKIIWGHPVTPWHPPLCEQ